MNWNLSYVKDQTGKVAIVTGANSGLGYEVTKALISKSFTVVMAIRNLEKGKVAFESLMSEFPKADIRLYKLDLADLASIKAFPEKIRTDFKSVDLLINNAGVMNVPFGKTIDGFETQFGGNHLGHFALTAQLLQNLSKEGRVVTVSSFIAKQGVIDFDNLNAEKEYMPFKAYAQSKLANLMFGLELNLRLESAGKQIKSLVAHPGYANTNLQSMGQTKMPIYMKIANAIVAQSAASGALPILRAALDESAKGGEFYGPNFMQLRGAPVKVEPYVQALDLEVRKKLWGVSEEMTKVRFEF